MNVTSHPSVGDLTDVTTITLWERAVHLAQALRPVMQEYFGRDHQKQQFFPYFRDAVGNVMTSLKPSPLEFFVKAFPSITEFLQEISPSLIKIEGTLVPSKTAFLKAFTSTFQAFLLETEPYILKYTKIMVPVCQKFYNHIGTVLQVLIDELGPIVLNSIQVCIEGHKEILTEILESLSFIDKEVIEVVDIHKLGNIVLELNANITQIKLQEVEQALELKRAVILAIRATTNRIVAAGITKKSLQCILDPTGFFDLICPGL